jgi:ElaB/YqjD/DUF883 family membrane-anchored ribosome-binding protein
MELANVAVVVSQKAWRVFGMADETTGETIEGTAESVENAKRTASDTIREKANELGSQAAERARAFAGEGKEKATGALDEVAKMMQSAALDVDARLGEQYGKYARTAADGIAGFADNLRGKEVDDLIDDVTAFVRKSPAVAVGVAAGLGFVLARLIKSGIDAASDAGDKPDAPAPSDKA